MARKLPTYTSITAIIGTFIVIGGLAVMAVINWPIGLVLLVIGASIVLYPQSKRTGW